jgi:hypothetical protein
LLEEGFQECASGYRAGGNEHAVSIADRLAETADDIPAQLVQEYLDVMTDALDDPNSTFAKSAGIPALMRCWTPPAIHRLPRPTSLPSSSAG